MIHSTFQHSPPPHSHTLSVYTVQCTLGRGEGGGGQREGTVEGQQYTSLSQIYLELCMLLVNFLISFFPY